ncbi:MAG: DNA polymerase I [Proteobacteria bacterium]|nr:DNA polymerase I [Pseudomonadota bacterium]
MATARKPAKGNAARSRVFLIDGSGYIFRAYHALPSLTRKRDGLPVGAVIGFCNMLYKLLEETFVSGGGTHIAVIFDAGRITFRNDIYKDYKAHRPEAPEDLVPQFGLIRDATRAFNVACVERQGFEADDLIATYARLAEAEGAEVVIVSSDKDLMQLVRGGVTMLDPIKNRPIGPDEVREKFGVGPDKVVEVQALCGDATDNVPGVPGIGVKTAAQLINEYGDLETLLARAGEIKQPKRRESLIENADLARVSRELVLLRDDVEVDESVQDFVHRPPEPEALLAFLDDMEFGRLAARIRARLEGDAGSPVEPQAAATGAAAYRAVQTVDELKSWADLALARGAVALQVQTSAPGGHDLVGFALALDAGRACYVPLAHEGEAAQADLGLDGGDANAAKAPKQIPRGEALAIVKPMLEHPGVLKIGHDIKAAMLVFGRLGIDLAPIEDAMLLSYGLEAGVHGHGLADLAKLWLDHDVTPYKELTGSGKSQITFGRVPLDKATSYVAEAADLALQLQRVLKPRLVRAHLVSIYETMDRPLVPVLAAMEAAGIRADPAVLHELSNGFAARIAALEADIHRLAGREFNVGSPKQLGEILFEDMGLRGGRKTKTGAYGTGADILESLAAEGHELPERVLDWRQLSKLKNTYTDTLPGNIDPETGRIHTSYAMAVAPTGRLSSNDPNLQNIPIRTEEGRKIRRAFVPAPGCKLLSADYSQIELRLLADIANIETLREAFRGGVDIHALTASEVFGVPVEGMDPMVRRRAKAINFGIIYGISPFGLARQLGIPQGQAKDYIAAYFERYPGIRDYMDSTKAFCRAHGYVETIYRRRVHLPGINDKNPAHRAFSERASINAPLQGSAADIIKRAMIRMPDALANAKLSARMLLQVHDELVFEVPDDEVEETSAVAKKVMEGAAHLAVPITVDTGAGDNWDEAH